MTITTTQLPPILEKATEDQWTYLLETNTGQQFLFGTITVVSDEWVQLNPIEDGVGDDFIDGPRSENAYRIRERGISIRLDAIAWVADGYS